MSEGGYILSAVFGGMILLVLAIRRWIAPLGYGVLGIMFIIAPVGFSFADGISGHPYVEPAGWFNLILVFAGVIILAADAAGKLPKQKRSVFFGRRKDTKGIDKP